MSYYDKKDKALDLAESSREEWEKTSFLKNIFMGKFDYDLIHPFPQNEPFSQEFQELMVEYRQFLLKQVDPDRIDQEGKIPSDNIQWLKEKRFFALKIGKEYGGHGFTQREYNEILRITGTRDGNLVALLSAHQSIGVPQPLLMFGNEQQKKNISHVSPKARFQLSLSPR